MAEFNILYDEDERGTYHHLYTRAFAKRFFFEVVQRHRVRRLWGPGHLDPPGSAVALPEPQAGDGHSSAAPGVREA